MRNILSILVVVFVSTFILISCSDDPVTPQQAHFDAEGIVFLQSGIKIGEIFRGITTDTLYAPEGSMTPGIDVKFYNSAMQMIDPPSDPDTKFAWEITDTSIVSVWQHPGEEGDFEFHLNGLNAGSTQIEFFIMHDNHADFRSGKITVTVQ